MFLNTLILERFTLKNNYEDLSNIEAIKKQREENKQRAADHIHDEVEYLEIEISKRGIIEFLNTYASYSDNG